MTFLLSLIPWALAGGLWVAAHFLMRLDRKKTDQVGDE